MPKPRPKPDLSKYQIFLDTYKRTRKPFLHDEFIGMLKKEHGASFGNHLAALRERAVEIDREEVAEYFRTIMDIKIDLNNPDTFPTHYLPNLEDRFAEIKNRGSEFGKKIEIGGGQVIATSPEYAPHINIYLELKEYKKAPKPPICREILSSTDWLIGHELMTLLKVAKRIRKEKIVNSQEYSERGIELLTLARDIIESQMVYFLEHWPAADQDAFNFFHNIVRTTKLLQEEIKREK